MIHHQQNQINKETRIKFFYYVGIELDIKIIETNKMISSVKNVNVTLIFVPQLNASDIHSKTPSLFMCLLLEKYYMVFI